MASISAVSPLTAGNAASALTADQQAADAAINGATRAATQLADDQKAQAAAAVLAADQQAIKVAQQAEALANAKLAAAENSSTAVNITV